ncbi:hypothetical protein HDR63_03730 [bacterium]|nr:hypothetical protein [bacterium]
MNKFFKFLSGTVLAVSACTPQADWYTEYGDATVGDPTVIQSVADDQVTALYGGADAAAYNPDTPTKNIAVLLPLSGENAEIGRGIRAAVETAVLARPIYNAAVSFYDVSGAPASRVDVMNAALGTHPEIIIGPVFADDVRRLREIKPKETPVLAFSSDAAAMGDGVLTMALMPQQSIETIVREMATDGAQRVVIMAPDTASGGWMARAAITAMDRYNVPVAGLFYYTEKNSDSIKDAAAGASMYAARTAANTRAREVLADILTNETLTAWEKDDLTLQLDRISKTDTLGAVPFDAVLFLGDWADSKTLASFLRYDGVGARDARFYATALWDGTPAMRDLTFNGAKMATLPEMPGEFSAVYEMVAGRAPTRLDAFGYDAANLAMGAMNSGRPVPAYLLDPSGYSTAGGLVRLRPSGISERALRVVQLNASDTPRAVRAAASNFITPIYNMGDVAPARPAAMGIQTRGINPAEHITIPARFVAAYPMQTYGATIATAAATDAPGTPDAVAVIVPDDDGTVITNPDFQPVSLGPIRRTMIESVEIAE